MRARYLWATLLVAACATAAQDEAGTGTAEDEAALRAGAQRYAAAWNARQVDSIIVLMADTYEAVLANGSHTDGLEAVRAEVTGGMAGIPAGVTTALTTTFVQFLDDHAAVAGGTYAITGMPPGVPSTGAWMTANKKIGTEWKVVSVTSAPDMPMPAAPDSAAGTTQ